jgi:hypothetical protein
MRHRIKSGGYEPAVGVHSVERSAWCATNHLQARLSNHGGLTPPALGCTAYVCREQNDFCDARTHIHKSGGRQPAVGVGKRTSQDASAKRTAGGVLVQTPAQAVANPRGLTPPALGAGGRLPAKNDFCDARTQVHKSRGCGEPNAVPRKPRVQRLCDTESRAGRQPCRGSVKGRACSVH